MSSVSAKNSCIFITGGHTTPAVACIEELKRRGFSNLIFIGQRKSLLFDKNDSAEFRLITEKVKVPFKSLITGKLSLFLGWEALIWLLRMPVGFIQSLFWQVSQRPQIVLTFGSHLGIPVAFWAWVFGTPVVVHEQTVTLGRAQKLIQKFAKVICYSWKDSHSVKQNDLKFHFTGNPIRRELLVNPTEYKIEFSDPARPILLVTGGNQGAHALNEYIFAHLSKIAAQYNIIHQTGSNTKFRDYEKAAQLASQVNSKGISYQHRDYLFGEEMSEAYHRANIIFSRAGANTVTELLALKKKAVLVPIPTTAGNEQFLNADLLASLGLGLVVPQKDLNKTDPIDLFSNLLSIESKHPAKIEELSSSHLQAESKIIDILEEHLAP